MGRKDDALADKLYAFKKKWDYFWEYYKIHFFVCAALIIITVFIIAQCATDFEPDANIAYIGPKSMNNEISDEFNVSINDLLEEFNEVMSEDLNGDKKLYAKFINFYYIPPSKVEEAKKTGVLISDQSSVKQRFDVEIFSGDTVIYFLDPEVYRMLKMDGMFETLPYVLGYLPENAVDNYHIKLADLPIYTYFPSIGMFPEDTVIAVRAKQTMNLASGKNAQEERYERNYIMLKKLIEFEGNTEIQQDD